MTSTHELCAKARGAEDAINAAGRDPTEREAADVNASLARAYRFVPTSFAEIAALAALLLHAEDIDSMYRPAVESIRDGAEMLAQGGKRRTGIDPAVGRCEAARKAERALRRLLSKRDGAADDLARAEAALHLAYTTVPPTAGSIAALAGLVLYVEGALLEPEAATALRSIRRGARRMG